MWKVCLNKNLKKKVVETNVKRFPFYQLFFSVIDRKSGFKIWSGDFSLTNKVKMWTLLRKVISFLILTSTVPCCLAEFDVDNLTTNCPESDISFELTTGYVFTSPDSILDTRPGQN